MRRAGERESGRAGEHQQTEGDYGGPDERQVIKEIKGSNGVRDT
jgi:hypothetical protein